MISIKKMLTKILVYLKTHKHSASDITSGTLGVERGGTGKTTLASNSVLYGNGTSAIGTKASANGALYATEANGALSWGKLPVAQGGTGATTFTSNAVLYGNGTSAIGAKASANGALYATGANGALSWGTLPVAQGGTGLTASPSMLTNLASTSAANVLAASPRPGITGTLGIAHGGSGQTAVSTETTVADVVSAGSGFSVTTCRYAQWGKVAQIHIAFKRTGSAITSNQTITFGTLVAGKRPVYAAIANWGWNSNGQIGTDGAIKYYGTIANGTEVGFYSTFILA